MIELLLDDMIEISIKQEADFLRIKETLERIGKAKQCEVKTLTLFWNIMHIQGRYFLINYKTGLALNGLHVEELTPDERSNLYTISRLLTEWKLLDIVHCPATFKGFDMSDIIIVPYKDRNLWEMEYKLVLGRW
jgi:hypothetical protein